MIVASKVWKNLEGWAATNLNKSSDPSFVGGAPVSGFVPQLRKKMLDVTKANLFAQKVLAPGADKKVKELFNSLYQVQIFMNRANSSSSLPLMLGASEVRAITAGTLHVMGLKLPPVEEGKSLGAFAAEVERMDAASLKKASATPPNFEVCCVQGDVVFLPSGFFYLTFTSGGCTGVRFSTSPNLDGENERVRSTVVAVLDQHAHLKDSFWATWQLFLQSA
jgi:hypothetical protein